MTAEPWDLMEHIEWERTRPKTPDEIVGARVRQELSSVGLSQRLLASHLNVTEATVSNKLKGSRPWTVNDLVKVAEFLNVAVADLLVGVPWTAKDETATSEADDRSEDSARPERFELPTF